MQHFSYIDELWKRCLVRFMCYRNYWLSCLISYVKILNLWHVGTIFLYWILTQTYCYFRLNTVFNTFSVPYSSYTGNHLTNQLFTEGAKSKRTKRYLYFVEMFLKIARTGFDHRYPTFNLLQALIYSFPKWWLSSLALLTVNFQRETLLMNCTIQIEKVQFEYLSGLVIRKLPNEYIDWRIC